MTTPCPVLNHIAIALLFGLLGLPGGAQAADPARPNVLVIMADDLGFGDLSCYGATEIVTPQLDRLAASGLRFTSGYATASTCTPTRFSFLTGVYAFRQKGTGIAPPNGPAIIAEGTPTIASMLRSVGYRTAVIGKWHLGLGGSDGPRWNERISPGPLDIGFDHCFLLPTTNDRVPQVYLEDREVRGLEAGDPLWVGSKKPSPDHPTGLTQRDSLRMNWSHGHNGTIHNGISRIGFYTGGVEARFRDEDLADAWIEQSRAWMAAESDQPFFLFFASHDVHVPRMPHERFQGKSALGPRGDSILELDWTVGALLDELEQNGQRESTLVVFCSDNGPVLDDGYADDALEKNGTHRSGGPFRGGKYSVYEGGTRTPFLASWPGVIEPGVSDEMIATIDLYASLAALTGAAPETAEKAKDSVNVKGALLGQAGAEGREELVQQDNGGGGTFGFRSGQWKLLRHDSGKTNNLVVESPLAKTEVPKYQLFDLNADPREENDLFSAQPDVAARLVGRLEEIVGETSGAPKAKSAAP